MSGAVQTSGARPSSGLINAKSVSIFVVLCAVAFGLPLLIGALWIKVLTSVAIFALTSASIALLYRRLGLVSLAQVALMGCGGWVGLRLSYGTVLPFEINMLLAGVVTSAIGMVLSYPALRMRGLYLALVTLMISGAFAIVINLTQFPNGGPGFLGFAMRSISYIPRPMLAESDAAYFAFCVFVTALGFLLILWHERSKPGRAWAMIRRSEAVAMSVGINVTFYKVWAFALSGFLAGVAGALLAGNLQFLDARSFPASESIMIFALTIVGGVWSFAGSVIAAMLYRLLPAILNDLGVNGNAAYLIFGAALVHALVTAPRGIAGQLEDLIAKLNKKGDAQ